MIRFCTAILLLSSFMFGCEQPPSQPNIVFIMVDDMGWSDVGCYGSQYYNTPNFDQLASEGVRFTDAYMMPTCSPSRASLMTGLYPPKTGIYTVDAFSRTPLEMQKLKGITSERFIKPENITIAEVLKNAGYRTGHFGKWHLGNNESTYPLGQGFDVNVAGCEAGRPDSYFAPFRNIKNVLYQEEGDYLTDLITEGAIDFLNDHSEKPFFLYLSFYQVHVPIQAKQEWVDPYVNIAIDGRQSLPAYGAVVSYVDFSIGKVLEAIDQSGFSENTIIILTSDNGGQIATTSNKPLRGQKGNIYEGGIRVPLIIKSSGIQSRDISTPVTVVDHFPTIMQMAGITEGEISEHLDGKSLVPLLSGDTSLDNRSIYWHLPGYNGNGKSNALIWQPPAGAIRKGDWKLIQHFENKALELYNLRSDIGEQNDLSASFPDVTKQLLLDLQSWQKEIKAPIPRELNEEYNPSATNWIKDQNQRNEAETENLIY